MKQNKPYVIALTGSIATGKSTVSKIIKENGYEVLDSDKIVHNLYQKGNNIYNEVVNYFGKEILDKNNEIDRQKLGQIVFKDEEKLHQINKIVHKGVSEKLLEGINNCKDDIIFLDIPLLIEQKDNIDAHGVYYNESWLVYVNKEIQLSRLLKRDKRGYEESINIINAQMNIEEKVKYADVIINNEGTLEELKSKIDYLLKQKNYQISKKI